LNIIYNM